MRINNLSLKKLFIIFTPLFVLVLISFTTFSRIRYVAVPDVAFERVLIFLGIDSDGTINGLVKEQDIESVEYLDLSNKKIIDATGIEGFTSLKHLDISKNNIQRLDLCSLKKLKVLDCSSNSLLHLDVCRSSDFSRFNFMGNPKALKISWN